MIGVADLCTCKNDVDKLVLILTVKSSSRDKLCSLTDSHINRFPMLNAKNPDLGLDQFEHNPIVTYP